MLDKILTLPEVAILLKFAERAVYMMAQKAQLPAFKVRGQIIVQTVREQCRLPPVFAFNVA